MKMRLIATAILGAGMFAIPTMAHADYRHDGDRYERIEVRRDIDRHDIDRRDDYGDFDRNVPLCDVPDRVLRTLDRERRGREIESIQFVRRDGHLFYRFNIDGHRDRDMNIRVAIDGGLLGIEEAGPEYRPVVRHEVYRR